MGTVVIIRTLRLTDLFFLQQACKQEHDGHGPGSVRGRALGRRGSVAALEKVRSLAVIGLLMLKSRCRFHLFFLIIFLKILFIFGERGKDGEKEGDKC